MKFNKEIKIFLEKYININKTRLDFSEGITSPNGSLPTFLKNNIDVDIFYGTTYQGSKSYYTVIKPNFTDDNGEYDIDVAVKIKYNSDREGNEREYYDLIYNCLKKSDRYKDKVSNDKERSIRVSYDTSNGEFYVDLVPMFNKDNQYYVIDHIANKKEISGGFLFRDWVNEQNNKTSIEGSKEKFLKKVIRIYKFFKKLDFFGDCVRSVQLTLLLSKQIDKLEEANFVDISSSLYYISKELKNELLSCYTLPDLDLSNPKLSEEKFDRGFNEDKFQFFKKLMIEFIDKITLAYDEQDNEKSLQLRQEIFGDNFGDETSIGKNMFLLSENYRHAELPVNRGWIKDDDCKIIKIQGYRKNTTNIPSHNTKPIPLFYGISISPNQELNFYALIDENLGNRKIYRQVTNENNNYIDANNIRGAIANQSRNLGYSKKHKGYGMSETAKRRGKHRVKCYLLDSNIIVGESKEYIVNIDFII